MDEPRGQCIQKKKARHRKVKGGFIGKISGKCMQGIKWYFPGLGLEVAEWTTAI